MFAPHRYKNATDQVSDPNFNNVSLLLHGDGTDGAQNNTFLDSSSNNLTITKIGTPTQGSLSPFVLSTVPYYPSVNFGSGYFNGLGDRLRLPTLSSTSILTGDFTIECWINPSSYPTTGALITSIVSQYQQIAGQGGYSLNYNNTGKVLFNFGAISETLNIITSTNSISLNAWTHLTVCRQGSVFTLYINGVNDGTYTSSANRVALSVDTTIGNYLNSSGAFPAVIGGQNVPDLKGYIFNLRVVKGTALYTSNFTPPTSPVTTTSNGGATPSTLPTSSQISLLCNFANAGIFDNATKNNLITVGTARVSTVEKKFGTGSMLFNGSTDYCRTIAPAGTHLFGTGNFTIECWAYCTNFAGGASGTMMLVDFRQSAISEVRTTLAIRNNCFIYVTNNFERITSATILTNTWYYVAVVRSSGSTKLYVNGINVGATYSDTNNYLDGSPTIGNYLPDPTYGFAGYIDDVRITKGIARYTANFTPPTQAFPNL